MRLFAKNPLPCFCFVTCQFRMTNKMMLYSVAVLVIGAMGVFSQKTTIFNKNSPSDCKLLQKFYPDAYLIVKDNHVLNASGVFISSECYFIFLSFPDVSKEIYLSKTMLGDLPRNSFERLINLEILDLQHNRITTLPAGIFDDLENLKQLYLNNNPLSSVQGDLIRVLPSLRFLNLTYINVKNIDCEGFRGAIYGDVCFGLGFATFTSSRLCSLPSPAGSLIGAGIGVNGTYRVATHTKEDCVHGKNTLYIYECNAQGIFTPPPGPSCPVCADGYYGKHCDQTCSCYNGAKCEHFNGACSCKPGFIGKDCEEDINECMDVHLCSENSTCLNTYGSFKCICEIGYSFVGGMCALPSTPQSVALSSGAIAGIVAGLGIILVIVLTVCYKRNRLWKRKEHIRNASHNNSALGVESIHGSMRSAKPHELESRGSQALDSIAGLLSVTLPHELEKGGYESARLFSATLPHDHDSRGPVADSAAGLLSVTLPHEH